MHARRPDGYLGIRHETRGSDIASVLAALLSPERILGPDLHARVAAVEPDAWYPISLMLEVMDVIDTKLGRPSLTRMGRRLFVASHKENLEKAATSAGDVLFGFDGLYRHANRGQQIGGWKVTLFEPGRALLQKTTPHNCFLEEGIMSEALRSLGIHSLIHQPQCLREDGGLCVFEVTSTISDARWLGTHPRVPGSPARLDSLVR